MMASPPARWVLLIHQIPPKPDYLRVKVARRLQSLGAVAIKNSVYVLPAGPSTIEDFHWLVREIVADGGDASVCQATFVEGLADADVEELFRAARGSDYDQIARDATKVLKAAGAGSGLSVGRRTRLRSELNRLTRRLTALAAVDFFGSPRKAAAEEALGLLSVRYRTVSGPGVTAVSRTGHPERPEAGSVRGRTWVTREGVFVDRIGSAWLIRRFIDPQARFVFVHADGYTPAPGELRFDMFEAEFTHEGDRCTFETLLRWFGLQADPALREVGEIVHDIDVKDAKFARAEAAGIERLLAGLVTREAADLDRIERGAFVFDALYAGFRSGEGRKQRTRGASAPKATTGPARRRRR